MKQSVRRITEWWRGFRWRGMTGILAVFLLIAFVLFAERSGIRYTGTSFRQSYLPRTEVRSAENVMFGQPATCLLIQDSRQEGVSQAAEQIDRMLLDMKVGVQTFDLAAEQEVYPDYSQFQTVVILMPNLDPMGIHLSQLMNWVQTGGNVMFAMTMEKTSYFSVIAQKLGVEAAADRFVRAESLVPEKGFMLGGGTRYELSDPFESSLGVGLDGQAQVYAKTGDEGIPLVWSRAIGKGRAVVVNFGIYVKAVRGIYAAAYSLLSDACAYPVLNGAAFYLDDFPAPVPGGNGEYIRRDYGMGVSDFYSRVWWPDLVQLAERHGIRYTGVMIENYEDDTSGTVKAQPDMEQFQYFGGLLLSQGGELGYHGYNHQPLCLSDTDYRGEYSYNTWKDEAAMERSVQELIRFQESVLPGAQSSVYVPPSNILSEAGRRMLGAKFPKIRTIASNFFDSESGIGYGQEFEVAEDGIVEQPRIVSGGLIDDYMRLTALSELNMHFVSTHFIHPDDMLDEDRGAKEGWAAYYAGLEDYYDWLDAAAPQLRMLTATELSASLQRYAQLTVSMQTEADAWTLTLGNFADDAWLFFRANGAAPGSVSGGTLTHLDGDLYLLHAKNAAVRIERRER